MQQDDEDDEDFEGQDDEEESIRIFQSFVNEAAKNAQRHRQLLVRTK
jgi:hypothetical protein